MIDVYVPGELIAHRSDRVLGESLVSSLLKAEGVIDPTAFHLENTAVYIHRLPDSAVQTGSSDHAAVVRVQVVTPPGALQREGQKMLVREITDCVSKLASVGDAKVRTWVILTEAAEGGWGLLGTAFGRDEFAALAKRARTS